MCTKCPGRNDVRCHDRLGTAGGARRVGEARQTARGNETRYPAQCPTESAHGEVPRRPAATLEEARESRLCLDQLT
jgi:hypothetical protein